MLGPEGRQRADGADRLRFQRVADPRAAGRSICHGKGAAARSPPADSPQKISAPPGADGAAEDATYRWR